MKVWIVVYRADEEALVDGVEDEMFVVVYRDLAKAQNECRRHLRDMYDSEEETLATDEIDWAQTSMEGDNRRYLGRPKAEVDGSFELYQAEVV